MATHSVNLSARNDRIYRREFNGRGRGGRFSKWVNEVMNREFALGPEECIREELRRNAARIRELEAHNEKLGVKLAGILARTENAGS